MAREYQTGFRIKGDSRGAEVAIRNTRGELDKLGKALDGQTRLGKFASDGMVQVAARAAGMATAFVGVVAGIGRFAQSIADPVDRMRDLAIQTSTSTEFISSMAHAADLTGTSLEAFAKGMVKMQRSVSDLGAGLSTQVRAFDRLGLSYEQIRKLSPEDQFLEIADRIGRMGDASARTATSMEIFGRSGAELIPLFAEGREGIEAMRAEAERLGLVVSKEFADAADQFNDNLTRAKGVVNGLQRQIGEGLLPELNGLTEAFLDNAEASKKWRSAGELTGEFVRKLIGSVLFLKELIVSVALATKAAAEVVVETLVLIGDQLLEFNSTLARAFAALIKGDFSQAAAEFSGLGDRMAESFKANFAKIGETLDEFSTNESTRLREALEFIAQVMYRQAAAADDAGDGMDTLGDETDESRKKAEAAAKAFQTLTDRLDPLARLQREFTVEQAILAGKIAEGGDQVAYYELLLEALKEEYAAAAREAVGFGDSAEKAAERAAKAAEREAEKRAKALAKSQADMETFQKAFERGVERMDDLGADLWKGWFTGAKNALSSIKDFFLNWLGEMAHAAITRPILIQLQAALGLGAPAAAMAGVGAGGVGSAGAGGGGFGFGGIGSLASLFTGSSIGLGLQNLPTWLGGTNGGLMSMSGGLFGNAAAYSNLAYGGTGLIAGLLGQKIFGGHGGIGAGLGSVLGLGAGGPIGALLGGLLGGAFGGLFGGKSTPDLYAAGTSSGARKNAFAVDSALGGLFLGHDDFDDDLLPEIVSGIQQFDDAISQFLSRDQLGLVTQALKSWNVELHGEAITMDALLGSRFTAILSTFSEDVQKYVREVSGLENQVERLGLASIAEKIIAGAPELFEGKTFRDFIAVAEQMQGEGEDLTATFQRLVATVVQIADQLTLVRGFAGSDLATDYNALVAGQAATPRTVAAAFADQIRDLGEAFTGSSQDLATLSQLVTGRYDAEIAYLRQIDGIIASLSDSFKPLREQIERDLIGEAEFGRRAGEQAKALADALATMSDPAQIAATVQEIQRLAGVAYSSLDEEAKRAAGQAWLDFLTGVENTALGQLTGERDSFLSDSAGVRELVDEIAAGFGDPLDLAAQAHTDAAGDLEDAANLHETAAMAHEVAATRLVEAASFVADAGRGIGIAVPIWTDAIQDALAAVPVGAIVTDPAGSAVVVPAPVTSGAVNTQTAKLIATVVASEVRKAGNEAATAIRQSPSQVQLYFGPGGPSMVNG